MGLNTLGVTEAFVSKTKTEKRNEAVFPTMWGQCGSSEYQNLKKKKGEERYNMPLTYTAAEIYFISRLQLNLN